VEDGVADLVAVVHLHPVGVVAAVQPEQLYRTDRIDAVGLMKAPQSV
jgi:hypothetical protein